MNDSMFEELEEETCFTTFEWQTGISPIIGEIRARKGSLSKLTRFAARAAGSLLIFGIEHDFKAECIALSGLLHYQLRLDRVSTFGFEANDHLFDSLVDTLLAISTGAWEGHDWEWLVETSSPEEYDLLCHPKDFSPRLLSPGMRTLENDDIPGVVAMQDILRQRGAAPNW